MASLVDLELRAAARAPHRDIHHTHRRVRSFFLLRADSEKSFCMPAMPLDHESTTITARRLGQRLGRGGGHPPPPRPTVCDAASTTEASTV